MLRAISPLDFRLYVPLELYTVDVMPLGSELLASLQIVSNREPDMVLLLLLLLHRPRRIA